MKVISVINHKGGVGKTTLVFNLAYGLVARGYKVLCIDTDPQGSLSDCFGFAEEDYTILEFYQGKSPVKLTSVNDQISLLPADLRLESAKLQIMAKGIGWEKLLTNLVRDGIKDDYDFCLIDCPPSLGPLTANAMVMSDYILVSLKPEYLSMRGLDSITYQVNRINEGPNPYLKILGVVFNQVKDNTVIAQQSMKKVEEVFRSRPFESRISYLVSLAEIPGLHQSIFDYEPKGKSAQQYNDLVDEFLLKIKEDNHE